MLASAKRVMTPATAVRERVPVGEIANSDLPVIN
jgi:hypothetical protein